MSKLYSGLVGLRTNAYHFDDFVMKPQEIKDLFANKQKFVGRFVYPSLPADSFNRPPVFWAEKIDDTGLTLKTYISANKHPKFWATWFAETFLLLKFFFIKDRIAFDQKNGFGEGSFLINTVDAETISGKHAPFTKFLLGVKDRPGLFLKIARSAEAGTFWPELAIFFPAQAKGFMHKAVKSGEAFVLVKQGTAVTEEMLADIRVTFDHLVKRSYGAKDGLTSITTHQSLDNPGLVQAPKL